MKKNSSVHSEKLAVKTSTLMELLDCGKPTAIHVGTLANAKIIAGRKILWNVCKIQTYLDSISE